MKPEVKRAILKSLRNETLTKIEQNLIDNYYRELRERGLAYEAP